MKPRIMSQRVTPCERSKVREWGQQGADALQQNRESRRPHTLSLEVILQEHSLHCHPTSLTALPQRRIGLYPTHQLCEPEQALTSELFPT